MTRLPKEVRRPDCGTELVAEPGIAGLCPQCLLSLALQQSPAAPADFANPRGESRSSFFQKPGD
jgi:hypothetical protein